MFTVEDILNLFLTPSIIESMGNWYPRVIAVMSCVIPFTYLVFCMVLVFIILLGLWKLVTGK